MNLIESSVFVGGPEPCALCDPYGYPWTREGGAEAMLCASHWLSGKPRVTFLPHLPPGWWPSWKRGTWA